MYFSLNEKEGYAFEKALSGEASEAGRAFLANEEVVQAWCKMGKVSDEENERLYIVGKMGGDARRYYMKNVYTGKNADYTERVRLDVKKYCTV